MYEIMSNDIIRKIRFIFHKIHFNSGIWVKTQYLKEQQSNLYNHLIIWFILLRKSSFYVCVCGMCSLNPDPDSWRHEVHLCYRNPVLPTTFCPKLSFAIFRMRRGPALSFYGNWMKPMLNKLLWDAVCKVLHL